MSNRIFICAAVILVLVLLGLLAYDKLEIYDRKAYNYPSREYYNNEYLALEQWLNDTGHPVRRERFFYTDDIASLEENVALTFYSAIIRNEPDYNKIISWIESGNYFILCIDDDDMSEEFLKFILDNGINILVEEEYAYGEKEEIFDFNHDIYFEYNGYEKITAIKDKNENIRLLEIPIGYGALTVISIPRFMRNTNLKDEKNARLAWDLTGARANGENTGVVITQNKEEYKSDALLGKLLERGNFLPVGISLLILLFIGFWSVIPVFGLILFEKPKTSRPIKERFVAEIQFLKKYKTLNHYLKIYNREQKIEVNPENEKEYNYRELINQYRRIFYGTAKF